MEKLTFTSRVKLDTVKINRYLQKEMTNIEEAAMDLAINKDKNDVFMTAEQQGVLLMKIIKENGEVVQKDVFDNRMKEAIESKACYERMHAGEDGILPKRIKLSIENYFDYSINQIKQNPFNFQEAIVMTYKKLTKRIYDEF